MRGGGPGVWGVCTQTSVQTQGWGAGLWRVGEGQEGFLEWAGPGMGETLCVVAPDLPRGPGGRMSDLLEELVQHRSPRPCSASGR